MSIGAGGDPVGGRSGAARPTDVGLDLDRIDEGPTAAPPTYAAAPVGPRPGRGRPSRIDPRDAAIGVLLFAFAVIAPLFRETGTRSWQAFLAEDGSIYTQQAIREGSFRALLHGYAGYLQLPPRLVALPAPLVPARDLTVYYAIAGTLVAALLGWFVYWASQDWVSGRAMRVVLASFVVIMPALGGENTANGVNTIWLFAATVPWALISMREGRRDTVLRSVLAFLAAAGTPVTIAFLPIAIGWSIIRRTRSALSVALSFGAGLVLQGFVILTARDTSDKINPNSMRQLFEGLGARVYAVFVLGTKGVDHFGEHSVWIYLGLPLLVLILFAVLLVGAPLRAKLVSSMFMVAAVISWIVPVMGRGSSVLNPFGLLPPGVMTSGIGLRYSVIALVMLGSAFVTLIAPPGPSRQGGGWQKVRIAFAVQVTVLALLGFEVTNYRSVQPQWRRSVNDAYITACGSRPSSRKASVRTNIFGSYSVELPCWYLAP